VPAYTAFACRAVDPPAPHLVRRIVAHLSAKPPVQAVSVIVLLTLVLLIAGFQLTFPAQRHRRAASQSSGWIPSLLARY